MSLIAAFAIALPVLLWQMWAFLAPAVEPHFQRVVLVLVGFATALFACGVLFMYYVVLPRALDFLTSYDEELYDIQIRASYYYSFVSFMLLAGGIAFLLPVFVLGLVRLRVLSTDTLRRNRRIAFVVLLVFAALLPTVDPVSLAFEVIPLVLLFEVSIWLAVLLERRWQRVAGRRPRRGGPVRVLSADWVVPVDGDPIRDGAVAIEDGLIAAVGAADDLGAGEHYEDAVILPGFVNAHTHLEYAVYAGFGDGLSFAPWIGLHVQRKAADRPRGHGGDRTPRRLRVPALGHHDGRGLQLCGGGGDGLRRRRPVRGDLPRGVRARDGGPFGIEERFVPIRDRIAGALSDSVRLGISPHAPYTCTLDLYRACAELGLPIATHLAESEAETEYLRSGSGSWADLGELLVPPLGTTGIRALAENGLLGSHVLAAHCVHADEEEIELLASHDVAVAHCPRSNAYLGCGVAPLAALREAGVRVCIATDSPNSTPSFDMFDEIRAAVVAARARERRPDALTAADALELATLGGARALGLDSDRGSLTPGKRADLTVLSLAGSPFLPWEDPVTATVLGGAPERVVATLVSGQPRYRKGGKTWLELIDAAHSARERLLLPAGRTS